VTRAKPQSIRPRKLPRDQGVDDQHASGTRLKRAAIAPDAREAIDASLDAALRDLDRLEMQSPRRDSKRRRVPPFPGTGISVAVPPLPSSRPKRR
jgi:hypothetical protein